MEMSQYGLLDEAVRVPEIEHWASLIPITSVNEFLPDGWNFASFDEGLDLVTNNPNSLLELAAEPNYDCPFSNEIHKLVEEVVIPPLMPIQEDYPSMMANDLYHCKAEMDRAATADHDISSSVWNMGSTAGNKSKQMKKSEGHPSKNLMAERRRRKRLNDRLSMLRSIVPKISKMDRTSILCDTIDYMKELLEKIQKLREEGTDAGIDQKHLMESFNEPRSNDISVKNPPKFDVERRNMDTRIEICCTAKPGQLLSTVNTLESLGLDIQHCVISCFNDFSVRASCSEGLGQRTIMTPEDIRQALFRNTGSGGRCV